MKTQNITNKKSKLLFTALVALVLMNGACAKKNNDPVPPPPVVTPTCAVQPCIPGMVGQILYGGTTTAGFYTQAQFQVTGEPTGYGAGAITGSMTIKGYVCQVGQPNLDGVYAIQMTANQPGYVNADVFTGSVTLVGPQGSIPAFVKVVPTRTQQAGLFTIWFCGAEHSMNF